MRKPSTVTKLYMVAFGGLQQAAKQAGVTIRTLIKKGFADSRGKVFRRSTPGAFGYKLLKLNPIRGAKRDRRGCEVAGNSRQRRFARRHPQHFTTVPQV